MIRMTIFLSALISWSAFGDVIYGPDNRHEVYEVDAFYQDLARSTAALIHKTFIKSDGDVSRVTQLTLKKTQGLCEDERFVTQTSVANCSGFLVGPDLIATAGHCIKSETCKSSSWVFDFKMSQNSQSITLPTNNVYSCKRVLGKKRVGVHIDAAIIQLDRPVTDRSPLKLSSRKARQGDDLVMIGHPDGLPTKVTDGGQVKGRGIHRFRTNLDAFHGNSGSAVMNPYTGEVVGILVNGKRDYVRDGHCNRVRQVRVGGGEWVSDIAQIFEIISL